MPSLSFKRGSLVRYRGRKCRVLRAVSSTELMVQDVETRAKEVANARELSEPGELAAEAIRLPEILDEDEMAEAKRRLDIIRPLLACNAGRMDLQKRIATENGISDTTVRRWVRLYEGRRLLTDLAPRRRRRKMPRKLDAKVEALIAKVIHDQFLTKQNLIARKVYQEHLLPHCRALKIRPPHEDTFRSRLSELSEKLKVERRQGRKKAHDRFGPVRAHFPGASFPLACVQVDHTPLDLILLDDEGQHAIGRPWLTLAIDVYSRMVAGYYLSLDAPSAFSVGMCIAQAAGSKDADLRRLGVDGEWPVWGVMEVLHADNGKDFRSHTLQRACSQYGIRIEWRPVRTPHWGGHIERYLGTLNRELHGIPGTTFSDTKRRGEYKSEKEAVMTFSQLERWLVEFIVNVYHQRKHQALGCPPLEQWRRGIVGHGSEKGIGLPEPVSDPIRFWRDFLPFVERSVERDGITWDKVAYWADSLRPWIDARKGGKRQKFLVRRDPRDISRIYFLDPDLGDYLEVPYRDLSKPSLSIWECREARRFLAAQGDAAVDEERIFAARETLNSIVETAKSATKKAQRAKQRRRLPNRIPSVAEALPSVAVAPPPSQPAHLSLVVDNSRRQDDFDIPEDLGANFEEL